MRELSGSRLKMYKSGQCPECSSGRPGSPSNPVLVETASGGLSLNYTCKMCDVVFCDTPFGVSIVKEGQS